MKQFATILFVLIFALAASSQSQNSLQKQVCCNSVLIENANSSGQNPILFQDDYFDVPDTNDLDGSNCVFDFQTTQYNFQYFDIKSVPAVLVRLQLFQVGELLLDLPPPSLSV